MSDQEKQPEAHPTPAGQYYLMEKIAQGGMAEIFKGLSYDVHGIKKTVCIKKILPQIAASKEFIDSLIDEAKVAVSLSHGNIAQTYDLGKVGDDYFMVMEFVEGRSLSQINRRCRKNDQLIPIPYLCYFVAEVLGGLDYMHRRADERGQSLGIVHRDISPQNIMVSFSGTVKIIDFGIAKSSIKIGTTDSGILKGKFAYMSPEQARGDPIDHRSDIFSLGVIFHEMITGQRLFKAEENRETLRNVRRARVDPPSKIREELPPELDEIILHALAKDRKERYPLASDMHDELVKFLYTTHPNFKPSDAAAYVVDLFKDDLPKSGEEREAGTPYLIIDHTSSALVDREQFEDTGIARAPIDVKHYTVGELPRHEAEETTPPSSQEPEEEIGPDEETPRPPAKPKGGKRKDRMGKALGFSLIAAALLVAVAIGVWKWSQRPKAPPLPAPEIPVGRIIVTTTPPDAKVFVDDEFVGSGSPVTVSDIPSDKPHMLGVKKEGYVEHTRRFTVKPNAFSNLQIKLQAVKAPTSTIAISSTPPGATVFLDDAETKHTTPATIPDVAPGKKHVVGLHLKNHRFWTTTITTGPNETQNFHVQLAFDYGSLAIESQPRGALVLIDGKPSGQTPLAIDQLMPGTTHRIEVWQEGYKPIVKEVYIKAGKKEELHLELEKAASRQP